MASSLFQSKEFGELQKQIPRRGAYWIVDSLLVVRQALPFGKSWLWAPYPDVPISQKTLVSLAELAKEQNAIFCRVEPFSEKAVLKEKEIASLAMTTDRYTPQHSLLLDLNHNEEEILKQMKPKGRYNINVAKKHGVTIEKIDAFNLRLRHKDFEEWYRILWGTGERDGFGIHERAVYEKLLGEFREKAALFIAKKEKIILGGIIVVFYSDTATYYYGASDHSHRQYMAPYLLQWEAICEAKKRGMRFYDFLGIAPPDAKNHPWAGVTEFKKKFGGIEVSHPQAYVIVYKRLWWLLYQLIKRLKV